MRKIWKWILLGFGVALICFVIAFAAFRHFAFAPFMLPGWGGGIGHLRIGMMPGMLLFGLFRVALIVAVLGFAIYGIVALFRRAPSKAVAPLQSLSDSDGVKDPARQCVKCSKPLEEGWKNCPYCGKKQ